MPTWGEIAQLVIALCTLASLVSTLVAQIRLTHLSHQVNSVKDELVASTRTSALAEGEIQGRDASDARQAREALAREAR